MSESKSNEVKLAVVETEVKNIASQLERLHEQRMTDQEMASQFHGEMFKKLDELKDRCVPLHEFGELKKKSGSSKGRSGARLARWPYLSSILSLFVK